jgi:hypothetical protein
MSKLSLENIRPVASNRIKPFLDEIINAYGENIHSLYITGTAITEDFHEERSDVNSICVLKEMNFKFFELLASLGRRYSRQKIAAPLIMTQRYIHASRDVFPIEFLNFKLIHETIFGEDILKGLEIGMTDLRRQCERELKVKLISLGQGYISSLGDRKILTEGIARSITGDIPLFRGIIYLFGKEPPVRQHAVIKSLSEASRTDTEVLDRVLRMKHEKIKLSLEELNAIFGDYYAAIEKLGEIVDGIKA